MDIRKIILEEVNDFDWVDDIPHGVPYIGMVFKHKADMNRERPEGINYEVTDITDNKIRLEWIDGRGRRKEDTNIYVNDYMEWLDNEQLIFSGDINESNEFDEGFDLSVGMCIEFDWGTSDVSKLYGITDMDDDNVWLTSLNSTNSQQHWRKKTIMSHIRKGNMSLCQKDEH